MNLFFNEKDAEKHYSTRFNGRIFRGYPVGYGTYKINPYKNERFVGDFTFHTGRYEDYRYIVKNCKHYDDDNKLVFEGDIEYSNKIRTTQYNGVFYDKKGNITEKIITTGIKDEFFFIGKEIDHIYYKYHHYKKYFDIYGIKYQSEKGYHMTDNTIWKLQNKSDYELSKGKFVSEAKQYNNNYSLIYQGGCVNFKRNGIGVENYNLDDEYKGQYYNNLKHGLGLKVKSYVKTKFNLGYEVKIDSILDKIVFKDENISSCTTKYKTLILKTLMYLYQMMNLTLQELTYFQMVINMLVDLIRI